MPLRALLNGENLIPPFEDEEWESMQQRVRAKEIELRLPCCQGLAHLRLSPRGVQHFVHFTNSGCAPESEMHLLAKFEIIRACRQLGFEAVPEYIGDGWRADVLVRSRKWSCCFEVQLSAQSFQETIHRQEVYRSHNLRCCWLFGELPEIQALSAEQLPLLSQYATPMFHLSERSSVRDSRFDTEVNGVQRPLRQFIADLLTKKLRYSQSKAIDGITAVVQLWKTSCPRCGYVMYFFHLTDLAARTACGAEISLGHNRFSLLYPESHRAFFEFYRKGIPPEIFEFLRVETQEEKPFSEFVCTGCGQTRLKEKPPSTQRLKSMSWLKFSSASPAGAEPVLNHWRDSPLCAPAAADSSGEIHDALARGDLQWKCVGIRDFRRTIDNKSRLPYRHAAAYRIPG